MKQFKSIPLGLLPAFTLLLLCALMFSCDKRSKSQDVEEEEEIAIAERIIEDSTFFDENAKYGRRINSVADLKGSQMFFRNCELGRYLVEIEDMSIFRNPENGVVQIGRLTGQVVWGDVPWKDIDVNNEEKLSETGWKPMETFADFTLEEVGSLKHIDVASMGLGTATINDYEIVVMRDMEGMENPSLSKVSYASSDLDDIDCILYKEWFCSNTFCSKLCEDDGADCNCPGYGFCNYVLNYECMVINCKKKCERYWPIGGLAWCTCE